MTSSSSTRPDQGAASPFWSAARLDQKGVGATIAALAVMAWAALIVWGASPYGRYLHHDSLDHLHLTAPVAVAVFTVGWTLMIVAMMLPTVYPVLALFAATVGGHAGRRRLLALCIAGYLVVWSAFGALAFAGDFLVHATVARVSWLEAHPWPIAAATFAGAGLYQFSDLKYRCLDACRSPRMFLLRHWHGRRPRRESFALGLDNGRFCLGCCWSLMLVMFAAGAGSIPFMLALGGAMAIEKNSRFGMEMSTPLGVGLLGAALLVVAHGVLGA